MKSQDTHKGSASPSIVMAIDVGGSHVKIQLSDSDDIRRGVSGPDMTAAEMVSTVNNLSHDLKFDAISIGFPGPVAHGKIISNPPNLGDGWVGYDFGAAFKHPVRLVNDALMQAVGSYEGGRMLFLGLGTGLGAAMIADYVPLPLEIAHLPYRKGKSFEDYAGEASRQKRGSKKWKKHIFKIADELFHALEPDYIVIGGGNVEKLDELPRHCRRGDNANAFAGGFRLWKDERFRAAAL